MAARPAASGGVRQGEDREQRLARGRLRRLQDVRRHLQAAAAGSAGAGPHGEFGHGGAPGGGGFSDLAVGHAIADADVHGVGGRTAGTGWPAIIPP